MADLGERLGLTWASPMRRQQPLWLPGTGQTEVELAFTYSCEGPCHLELLEGAPGSIWASGDAPGVHHLGYWVDDVGAVSETLVAQGWTLEAASQAPEHGYGTFSYVRSPSGVLVEPVSVLAKPRFEKWWAGEPLG
jgi:catechol 2,3-dioxygenase-like lactoylglutathione lyase family enzyme